MSQLARLLTHGATVVSAVALAVTAVTPAHASPAGGIDRPQKANRKAICEDGTWVSDGGDDSCDEYAFVATQESGGRLGLTGAQCAEVRPYQDNNGNRYVAQLRYNGNERCVRGHVPLSANTDVGGALGTFTLNQRLMDGDQYWVQVVS